MSSQNTNDINIKQNEPENLDRLYAQAVLYSSAKRYKGLQIFLSILLLVVVSLTKIYYYQWKIESFLGLSWETISPWLSLTSLFIALSNTFFIKEIISRRVKLAAIIQYEFDSIVLSIPINPFHRGDCASSEEIRKYSLKIKNKSNFDNWYTPTVSTTDFSLGKFLCLRSNFSWDSGLRKRYTYILSGCGVFITIVFITFNFISEITFKEFILNLIIPLVPLIIFIGTEIIDNFKTIKSKDKAKNILEKLSKKIIEGKLSLNEIDYYSASMLDVLYYSRKDNPLIFDHVYKLFKKKDQDETDYSIDKFIKKMKKN